MGIQVTWDDEAQTRLLVAMRGSWTWEEMYASADEVKAITDAAAPRVIAAIIDLSEGLSFPGGTIFSKTTLEHAKKMLQMGQDGTGPIAVVGASPLIKMAFNTLYSLDPKTLQGVRFAPTVAEARALLAAE